MKQTGSILKGTAVLTAAGIVVKLFGAVYRVLLSRLIGAEGIGLYQMAYPVYLIFLALSTAGMPVAISKIVAEKAILKDHRGIGRVLKAAFLLLLGTGLVCSVSMAFSARWMAGHLVSDPRAVYAIWALAPAILFMSVTAVFRGYFQGLLEMKPSAISQIFEQMVRVAVALLLAVSLQEYGIEHAAAGAAFGATAGGGAGLCYLSLAYLKRKRPIFTDTAGPGAARFGRELRRLIRLALPIAAAVILIPLLQALDTFLVPRLLQQIGYTGRQSTTMLGILGNSWAVINLPLIMTVAISANLVPAVASLKAAAALPNLVNRVREGFRLALFFLIPAAVALYIFGPAIYRIIYGESGVELLRWFALAVLFLGLEQVSAGTLQGLGNPKLPLINFTIGAFFKIMVTLILTGQPGLNLAGAAVGTVVGAAVTTFLNLFAIKRVIPLTLPFKIPVFAAGTAMFLICRFFQRSLQLPYGWEFLIGSGAGLLGYSVFLWVTGGIGRPELEIIQEFFKKKETA